MAGGGRPDSPRRARREKGTEIVQTWRNHRPYLLGVASSCAALLGLACNATIGSRRHLGRRRDTGTTGRGSDDPKAAGVMPLRRLTSREYLNTTRDLLGDTTLGTDDVPWRVGRSQQQRLPVPSANRHRDARRRKPAVGGRSAGEECRGQAVDPLALHAGERRRRSQLRGHVHHGLRREGLPPAAHGSRGELAERPLPDRPQHADARFQWRHRLAAGGDAPGARVHLPLGARPRARHQGRVRRAAGQLPAGEPSVVFPLGDDARHRAVHGGAERAAAHRGRRADANHAHARRQQGAGLRGRLHRRLAGRQCAGLAAQGSEALPNLESGPRERDGDGAPDLRQRHRARKRPVE